MKVEGFGLEAPVEESSISDSTSALQIRWEFSNNGITSQVPETILEDPLTPKATPEFPILVTRRDGRLEKLKRNLGVKTDFYTDAEGSDEIDEDELEVAAPIQRRRIQSTSLSPVQVNTTTNKAIRSPHLDLQPGHLYLPLPPPICNHP
ncbi:hypothetical protein O181_077846 [Austropuccinia psidii MF-1]|uniref:Uncharacterized protein n=1 Tax=Austropuccinia psidii MF-1 TaxID=1389203 RepID=A0A9Q3FIU9_9BASI|nr:hypothetical protein [Austropuccinia psidii MF-1]